MCLVGNGHSGLQYTEQIDACDSVVRLGAFPYGVSGKKWDIWFSSWHPNVQKRMRMLKLDTEDARPKELWGVARCRLSGISLAPKGAAVKTIPIALQNSLINHLRSKSKLVQQAGITSGLIAIAMALQHKPDELCLVGFDATVPKEPGWGYPAPYLVTEFTFADAKGRPYRHPHDLPCEKKIIADWVKTRKFCGIEYPNTHPEWWRLK